MGNTNWNSTNAKVKHEIREDKQKSLIYGNPLGKYVPK